jgi:hypothetical protein
MYQVEGANGKIRNTTLRDARKHNLVPSVTTILGVAAKPGLEKWKMQQVLFASLTLPRREGETEESYLERIMEDSKEQGRAAADEGTKIHAAIQQYYEGQKDYSHTEHVAGVEKVLAKEFGAQNWVCEQAFAHDMGFGGKCDMYAKSIDDSSVGIILDIKTKEFTDPEKVEGYDEHLMQLAAYRMGLNMFFGRCANVFVSRNVPGLVVVKEWSDDELHKGWMMFTKLLRFWQLKNDHK